MKPGTAPPTPQVRLPKASVYAQLRATSRGVPSDGRDARERSASEPRKSPGGSTSTSASSTFAIRETCDLEIPPIPSACTRFSTRLVDALSTYDTATTLIRAC